MAAGPVPVGEMDSAELRADLAELSRETGIRIAKALRTTKASDRYVLVRLIREDSEVRRRLRIEEFQDANRRLALMKAMQAMPVKAPQREKARDCETRGFGELSVA